MAFGSLERIIRLINMSENRYIDKDTPDGWELDHAAIRADVFSLCEKGVKLSAWWDAGGDSAPGGVTAIPEGALPEDLSYALYLVIIRGLNLPTAGFTYDQGTGELFFDEEKNLRLVFTSRESGMGAASDPDIERSEEYRTVSLDDPLQLTKQIHRLSIRMTTEINDLGKINSWMHVRVLEGEDITLSPQQQLIYTKQIESLLPEYAKAFSDLPQPDDNLPGAKTGGKVCVESVSFDENTVNLKVSFRFETVYEHKDENVILIDSNNESAEWKNRILND